MKLDVFLALWKHRFRKYSGLAYAYLSAYAHAVRLWFIKLVYRRPLIALIRTEHFGDIVALEPLSREARRVYGNRAYLVWIVKPVYKELITTNPAIDEAVDEYCVTQRRVLMRSGVFDAVHEFQFRNNNYCVYAQKFFENERANQLGINVFTYFDFGNLLEVFAKVGDLPLPQLTQPQLYLQEHHRVRVAGAGLPKNYVVIHCQSNYAPKDWPTANWRKLIDWLIDTYDVEVVEVGLSSNLNYLHPRYQNRCGNFSLLETAEVIRHARFFVGLDSGPTHLAQAVGTYGFVLMGALNNFLHYCPFAGTYGDGTDATLIRYQEAPCAELPLELVITTLNEKIKSLGLLTVKN